MRYFLKTIMPCWYEMSFLKEEIAILIRIHQDFAKSFKPFHPYLADLFLKRYEFDEFIGGLDGNFGFNGILTRRDDRGQFREFVIKIPTIHWLSEDNCEECGGLGNRKEPFEQAQCGYCGGSGRKTESNWKAALAISASLKLLFQTIEQPPEINTSAQIPQLMTLRISTGIGQDNSPIWAEYGIPVCNWFLEQEDDHSLPEIAEAIRSVYAHMLFDASTSRGHSAYIHDGHRFTLRCNSGQVFINGSHIMKKNEGCEATCAEIDNPVMQIALLAGLAKLQDLVREVQTA